jgi:hypothetical protein
MGQCLAGQGRGAPIVAAGRTTAMRVTLGPIKAQRLDTTELADPFVGEKQTHPPRRIQAVLVVTDAGGALWDPPPRPLAPPGDLACDQRTAAVHGVLRDRHGE